MNWVGIKKFASIFIILFIGFSSYNSVAEPFTLNCGHHGKYDEIRLLVDLEAKSVKQAWLVRGSPSSWRDFIIYDVTDSEVLAHSDDKFFTEVGVYSTYLVINRYSLDYFTANGEDWNHPAKDGNIKGSGADCSKLEKAF